MTEHQPLTNSPLPVRLRTSDYLMLDEAGAFDGYGKTELIEGEVYYMNAQYRPHARVKSQLFFELAKALQDIEGLEAIVEGSVEIPPHNAPEPDIVVTDQPEGTGLIPLPSVRLVVEVSDTTLKNDLGRKARIYAANGIPEYWVVDLAGERLHQMWSPDRDGYAEKREITFGETIGAMTVNGLSLILPAV